MVHDALYAASSGLASLPAAQSPFIQVAVAAFTLIILVLIVVRVNPVDGISNIDVNNVFSWSNDFVATTTEPGHFFSNRSIGSFVMVFPPPCTRFFPIPARSRHLDPGLPSMDSVPAPSSSREPRFRHFACVQRLYCEHLTLPCLVAICSWRAVFRV